jgi:aminoglycoside 2'-N-acetyltransferase I
MNTITIDIKPVAQLDDARKRAIIALCTRAYDEPFDAMFDIFPDATHVVASLDGEPVSHASWVPRTLTHHGRALRSAYVEAVATEPALQGRGYASAVLRALAMAIQDADIGALSPSDPAFYARLGWELWRGPTAMSLDGRVEPTPGEDVMILRLPRTPAIDLDGELIAPWRPGDVW